MFSYDGLPFYFEVGRMADWIQIWGTNAPSSATRGGVRSPTRVISGIRMGWIRRG